MMAEHIISLSSAILFLLGVGAIALLIGHITGSGKCAKRDAAIKGYTPWQNACQEQTVSMSEMYALRAERDALRAELDTMRAERRRLALQMLGETASHRK